MLGHESAWSKPSFGRSFFLLLKSSIAAVTLEKCASVCVQHWTSPFASKSNNAAILFWIESLCRKLRLFERTEAVVVTGTHCILLMLRELALSSVPCDTFKYMRYPYLQPWATHLVAYCSPRKWRPLLKKMTPVKSNQI